MINKIKVSSDIALLIARVILGGIFIYSGWMKVTDMPNMLANFSSMGIPDFLTYIVSYGELIGGAMLLLGLWTELAAFFLTIVMIVAVYLTRNMGYEVFSMPLVTLAGVVAILGGGAGKYKIK